MLSFHILNICLPAYEERALWLKVLKPLLINQGPFWLSHLLKGTMGMAMVEAGGGPASRWQLPRLSSAVLRSAALPGRESGLLG